MICNLCGDPECDCQAAVLAEAVTSPPPDGRIMQRPHRFLADAGQPDRCVWCKRYHGDDDVEAP